MNSQYNCDADLYQNGQKRGRVLKKETQDEKWGEISTIYPGWAVAVEEGVLIKTGLEVIRGGGSRVGAATRAGFDNSFTFSKEITESWN